METGVTTELISFNTPDGVHLDGAYYRPESGGRADTAVLLVHGKARNFYTGPSRDLIPFLQERHLTCLAINRRGHDVIYSMVGARKPLGAAWETFADSQQDLAGAVAWLRERGHTRLAIVGHSFGGVVSTNYTAEHPDQVVALVLCSPAGGTPQYLSRASKGGFLAGGAAEHEALMQQARSLVTEGRGSELLTVPGWWWAISADSALALSESVPDLVAVSARTTCPILAIRGTLEPADNYPIEGVAKVTGGRTRVELIPDGDHYYTGQYHVVGPLVRDWLAERLA
jgi:pimeloyl-ACP methyl ester carboxylesterase